MRKFFGNGILAGVALVAASGIASAGTFTFNFDSLAIGATSGTIATYMNGILGANGSVAITNVGAGVKADTYYNGDGHVAGGTCLGNGSSANMNAAASGCAPTLGSTGGANPTFDTYLMAQSSGGVQAGWTFAFTLSNIVIDSVAFDYEIFPDATCTKINTNCGTSNANLPDFTFGTNLNATFLHDYGVTPGNTQHGYLKDSLNATFEQTPQKLVTGYTASGAGIAGATSFTFLDWPATIGIDNFVVTYHTTTGGGGGQSTVPEPTSIILLGSITLLVTTRLRKKTVA